MDQRITQPDRSVPRSSWTLNSANAGLPRNISQRVRVEKSRNCHANVPLARSKRATRRPPRAADNTGRTTECSMNRQIPRGTGRSPGAVPKFLWDTWRVHLDPSDQSGSQMIRELRSARLPRFLDLMHDTEPRIVSGCAAGKSISRSVGGSCRRPRERTFFLRTEVRLGEKNRPINRDG